MNKELNLCEILKGHEGKIFYSPCCGYMELTKIGNYIIYFDDTFKTDSQGRINDRGECVIFPSKDQRDWNKWIEEQKSVQVEPKFNIGDKVLCKTHEIDIESICIISSYNPKAKEYKLLCGNATITYCKENCLEPYFDKGDRVVVTHGKYKNSVGIIEEYSADDDTWSITLNGYDYPINFAKEWIKKQEPKVPKTWSGLVDANLTITDKHLEVLHIEKSAQAFLKIHQLIEVGYGGNVTKGEWIDNEIEKFIITLNIPNCKYQFTIVKHISPTYFSPIAFHTKEQAEEFLSKPENVQLLKDYFMI